MLFYRYQVSYIQTIQWLMKISYDKMVMMNFLQDIVSSNSFCNHNCEWVSRFMHIESRWRQRWLTMIPSFKLWHDVKLWIAQLYIYFPKDVIWRVVKSSSRVKRVKGQLWPKLRKVRIWFQFDEGFQRINAWIRRRTLNVMVISDAKNMKMAAPKIAL